MKEIILVHDDQEGGANRKGFLEMAGYVVTTMQRGQVCLELLKTRKPALVILDVLLHGMNGFEICSEIRSRFSARELPVIMCTDIYRAATYVNEAKNVGAQRYLLRPTPLDEILQHVNVLVNGKPGEADDREANVA